MSEKPTVVPDKDDFSIGSFRKKEVPPGVYIEKLRESFFNNKKSMQRLKTEIPEGVLKLMTEQGALELYHEFVDAILTAPKGGDGNFKSQEVQKVEESFAPRFKGKGIVVYLCRVKEVRHNGQSTSVMYWKWLEFVDLAGNPEYVPEEKYERGKSNDECCVM